MVYSKYGPLVERLRYVATHPPELPVPWSVRSSGPNLAVSEKGYARSPLYRAERRMNRTIRTPWIIDSISDVQDYADAVLGRLRESYSRAPFPVRIQIGPDGSASYQGGLITLPLPVRQTTVLHELAHHLTPTDADHGQAFQTAYLFLLSQEMGPDTARKLVDNLQ